MFPIPVALAMSTQVSGIIQSGEVIDWSLFYGHVHFVCMPEEGRTTESLLIN